MDEELMLLISRLPGLEAAKKAIEDQIAEIHRLISASQLAGLQAKAPVVAGSAVPGRIKQKRNLSPEEREKRRVLIAAAREKRLNNLRRTSSAESSHPEAPAQTAQDRKTQK
jgi:hypothetical protein